MACNYTAAWHVANYTATWLMQFLLKVVAIDAKVQLNTFRFR